MEDEEDNVAENLSNFLKEGFLKEERIVDIKSCTWIKSLDSKIHRFKSRKVPL